MGTNEKRIILQTKLDDLFQNSLPDVEVWYQPPAGTNLTYPCIVYHRMDQENRYADNRRYSSYTMFRAVCMTRGKDDGISDKVLEAFPMSSFENAYTSDSIYHVAVNIYI